MARCVSGAVTTGLLGPFSAAEQETILPRPSPKEIQGKSARFTDFLRWITIDAL